ncbi:MAG: hypothetical protein R2792_06725 [Saprospiraceae bacterium]
MKNVLGLLVSFILLSQPLLAQTAEKTLSKSFNTENTGKVLLNLPGEIDLRVWDQPTIRVEIKIQLPGKSQSMLNELANVGRYNLISSVEENSLLIQPKNMQKQITVGGELLIENLSFQVFLPRDMEVEMSGPAALANNQGEK